MEIVKLFGDIDDFCIEAQENYKKKFPDQPISQWPSILSLSEVMTIMITFHASPGFRHFNSFYNCVLRNTNTGIIIFFSDIVSYKRFIELQKSAIIPLIYLFFKPAVWLPYGDCFWRANQNSCLPPETEQFQSGVQRHSQARKKYEGWFYGFKWHLVVNNKGEFLICPGTPGNVDDRTFGPEMTGELTGQLLADKVYISKELEKKLLKGGWQLIT